MFTTIRISLQPDTTKERARELGYYIAQHIEDTVGPILARHLDKVYFSVEKGDGNYLGP